MRTISQMTAALAMLLAGCGSIFDTLSDVTADDVCAPAEAQCVDGQLQTCGDDGLWSAPTACPTGQMCMTMDSGTTHCMASMDETATTAGLLYFNADAASNGWWIAAVDATAATVGTQVDVPDLSARSAPAADGGNDKGAGWGDAVAGSDGKRIFANAMNADRLLVYDVEGAQVEAVLEVGGRPVHLYNPNHNGEIWTHADDEGSFYVIDAETLAISGPLQAGQEASGHGKLLYAAELGERYYATNTNDPGIFPIDGAAKTVGPMIELCAYACDDDPDTAADESLDTCGGTHDKAYNPALDYVAVQCLGGRGYSFVDAADDSVVADMLPITGSVAHTPDNAYILVIDGSLAAGQVQIWDTAAAGHDGIAFDATVTVGDEPSARGTEFRRNGDDWEAWIPQTAGDHVAVLNLRTRAVELVDIGTLTKPEGAHHFSRRSAMGTDFYYTYNDDGAVAVDVATHEVVYGGAMTGMTGRLVFAAPAVDSGASGEHEMHDHH